MPQLIGSVSKSGHDGRHRAGDNKIPGWSAREGVRTPDSSRADLDLSPRQRESNPEVVDAQRRGDLAELTVLLERYAGRESTKQDKCYSWFVKCQVGWALLTESKDMNWGTLLRVRQKGRSSRPGDAKGAMCGTPQTAMRNGC